MHEHIQPQEGGVGGVLPPGGGMGLLTPVAFARAPDPAKVNPGITERVSPKAIRKSSDSAYPFTPEALALLLAVRFFELEEV